MAACVRSVSNGKTTTQAAMPEAQPAATRCALLSEASPEAPEGFMTFLVSVSYTCSIIPEMIESPIAPGPVLRKGNTSW